MANSVNVSGKLTRVKAGQSAKGPWAFGTIQPEGEPGRFDITAFDGAAEQLAAAGDGADVEINGRLWRKQDKKTELWNTVIKAEEVSIL